MVPIFPSITTADTRPRLALSVCRCLWCLGLLRPEDNGDVGGTWRGADRIKRPCPSRQRWIKASVRDRSSRGMESGTDQRMNMLLWITDFDGLKPLLIVCMMMYSQSHLFRIKMQNTPLRGATLSAPGCYLRNYCFLPAAYPSTFNN